MNNSTYGLNGAGSQTAGLGFAGYLTDTELYDGTSWTINGTMATPRSTVAAFGTQASAVAAGGNLAPGLTTATEEYTGPGPGTKTITVS
jgi:hypothetical protein